MNKPGTSYDPLASKPMAAIVRVAVTVITLALFASSLFNAMLGFRDISIVLALSAPLGLSALGFARAGHTEAAMVLLLGVVVFAVTLILLMNPLGVHDMTVTAYGGVVLVSALLLSGRSFAAITALTFAAATVAFVAEANGYSRSRLVVPGGWPQYGYFVIITTVFAIVGRAAFRQLFGGLGDAHHASSLDPVTGLLNRPGFLMSAAMRLRAAQDRGEFALLVVADLDAFRRVNIVIGHPAADSVLAEAGRRLSRIEAGEGGLVGRIGDDEFAILVTGLLEENAATVARTVHDALDFEFMGVSVRNAAGYARFPRDAHGIESLLLAAQSGVGHAKSDREHRLSGPADRI